MEDADDDIIFFSRVLHNENRVSHRLLPERNDHGYALRRRRHERTLMSNDEKQSYLPTINTAIIFSTSPLSIV